MKKEKPDILIFAGDYFEKKLSMTDTAAFYANMFFNEVMNIVKDTKTIVRMIQGTMSHELNQLQIFKPFEANVSDYNFKIIETAQTENICGMDILFLPEEYPQDSNEYYKEFKEKEYNAIFGHGTWDFIAFDSQIEHSNRTDMNSAPVFIYQDWEKTIPNGFVSFGHIHSRHVYKKKIFYSGSFSRWGFGEKSERGFTKFEYDLDEKTYNIDFINNTLAPKYEDIELSKIYNENTDIKELLDVLENFEKNIDNIRLILDNIPSEVISILKNKYSGSTNVKILVKNLKQKEIALQENQEIQNKFDKYHYITRRELPLNLMIQRFCKEDLNYEISEEKINKLLLEE